MNGLTSQPAGVRGLLQRLRAYAVDWKYSFVPTEDVAYEPGIDRGQIDIEDPTANVISSEHTSLHNYVWADNEMSTVPRHAVLLDIDYPAYLVPSSTPNHSHLYLDVPHGVPHEKYMELLKLLGECGIIERGYAEVSIARGHSDLRLPWVKKSDQKKHSDSITSTPTGDEFPF